MERNPEIFAQSPASVSGDSGLRALYGLGGVIAGVTDLRGNITYNADLYGKNGVPVPEEQIDDFLQTIAHEMQHAQARLIDRLVGQGTAFEDQIDRNADIMYRNLIREYRKRLRSGRAFLNSAISGNSGYKVGPTAA